VENKTRVIDVEFQGYFDKVRHHILLRKIAERIDNDQVMRLLKLILKANGNRGYRKVGQCRPCSATSISTRLTRGRDQIKN